MKKLIFSMIATCFAIMLNAQVTGTIVDAENGSALIGATVMFSGANSGTLTDIDGKFSLDGSGDAIEISYLGYNTTTIVNPGSGELGKIRMEQGGIGLSEVVVTGVMDIVQDRRTPVAVSTITTADIQAKSGNVEFPELMKSTPSIYVANQSGGYGDSEVFTRGFDQTNTAFLLNGQPINGMEDGKMYWSNWSGMTDVATAVQIQRGLGSSKLAISSVGGTTNIIMKPTEQQAGGSISYLLGNDAYNKITASYNTGMINGKFGVSALVTHWQGDGWANGTKGQGQSYFLSAGYKASEKSNFTFLITGAPQYHDQNYTKQIYQHYNGGGFDIKYNNNYGTRDGEYLSLRRNFYHKPVANLNWELRLNDKASVSTVAYASWGRGGGTGGYGTGADFVDGGRTSEGLIDWDNLQDYNSTIEGGIGVRQTFTGSAIRASVNNHNWYGVVSTYDNQINENLNFSIGADVRNYNGSHFRQLVDLNGLTAFDESAQSTRYPEGYLVSETFEANPWSALTSSAAPGADGQQIDYSNNETITYGGVFSQLEYTTGSLSAYVQGAFSSQNHVRFELFGESEESEKSESVNNIGYNIKGGASYSIDQNSNFYVNAGYYSRQPFHDNIYLNFSNTVNPVTENENIFGLEAGYKYSNNDFALNLNAYRTLWDNRTETSTIREGDSFEINGVDVVFPNGGFNNLSDLNQLHMGLELDFRYKLSNMTTIKGFGSIGNWKYKGDAVSDIYDDSRNLLSSEPTLLVDGIHVGGAAQTSFGGGVDLNLGNGFRVDLDGYHYSRLYANIGAQATELKLPSFNLFDAGIRYNVDLGNNLLTIRANVFNVLGTEYISRSDTAIPASELNSSVANWNGVNKANRVNFGKTRTWNISARYSF